MMMFVKIPTEEVENDELLSALTQAIREGQLVPILLVQQLKLVSQHY